jgi:nitroreductase
VEVIMPLLPLSPDELLATTRAVRKRLDFTRPVEREVIEECLSMAQQAPSGSNSQNWEFVIVTDPAKRAALAELYRKSWYAYNGARVSASGTSGDRAIPPARQRMVSSAKYLADHMQDVPVLVVPCIRGRAEGQPIHAQAGLWGSILPAAWSFMLAARARGLGTAWTSLHLVYERQAAAVLGIPYDQVMQAALIPLAYTIGTDFKEGPRESLDTMVHWDTW